MRKLLKPPRKQNLSLNLKTTLSTLFVFAVFFAVQAKMSLSPPRPAHIGEIEFQFVYKISNINLNKSVSTKIKAVKTFYLVDKQTLSVNTIQPKPNRKTAINADIQKTTITGKVTDSNGTPLPGANIVEKGTSNGTITDINGNYSIAISKPNTILEFRTLGFAAIEIPVNSNNTTINVILKEQVQSLEEVVIVGYGTQKKKNLTGAVESIKVDDLGERPVSNIQQRLQGVVANLNISVNNAGGEPGATQSINIRGTGSPYILLDGIPITSTQMSSINPSDIEDITILKDAASAAIYGSRGAFGVILITTKSGGNNDGKIKVTYNTNYALSKPTIIPKFANSIDFAKMYNTGSINDGNKPIFSEKTMQLMEDVQAGLIPEAGIRTFNDGRQVWTAYSTGYANRDWYEEMYKGWQTRKQHNLSLSGGSKKKTSYYLSGALFEQNGNLTFAKNSYDRVNFLANLNTKINNWLSLNSSAKYSRENTLFPTGSTGITGRGIIYHQISKMWPVNPLYNPDGDLITREAIDLRDGGTSDNIKNTTFLKLAAKFEPVKNWVTKVSYNWSNISQKTTASFLTAEVVQPDGSTEALGFNPNFIVKGFSERTVRLLNFTTAYTKSVNNKHNFYVMAGYEERFTQFNSLFGRGNELITQNITAISTTVGEQFASDGVNQRATQGVFGRLTYNFDEKYLVEFNGRYDGSSFFSKGRKWGFFPSASAGYNISREGFWKPLKSTVNYLKIRGSWGGLGNHDPSSEGRFNPPFNSFQSTWLIDGNLPFVVTPPGPVSPDLTWETVTTLDLGFDTRMFKNKLSLSFNWFKRDIKDMIGPVDQLPATFGTNPPQENNSEMSTKGLELSLNWKDHIGKFNYNIGFNIGDSKTIVTKYQNPTNSIGRRVGQEIGEIWGFKTVGFFESEAAAAAAPSQSEIHGGTWGAGDVQYADLNGDNKITTGLNTVDDPGDRTIIGNSAPRYNYGINLGANYKGIELSIFMQGIGKRDLWIGGNVFWGFVGNRWQNSVFTDHIDYWTPENTDAYFPKPYLNAEHKKNQRVQTKYLQNAAYMRVKSIQLSYTLPNQVLSRIGLTNLNFFMSGENLLTFTKLNKYIDPEATGGDWGAGKIYPLQKVISVGLNISL
ncbi:MAG: SusC/RagA family TonB-linked outer membrane protein [Tenacibaculum sp.]